METAFRYDRSLIEIFLSHRPPFLMVDSILSYKSGKNPSLFAEFAFKDEEPQYFKNDPDDHWPSMYILEGLSQSCNLLIVINALEKQLMQLDHKINSMDEVFRKLVDKEPDETTRFLKDILHQRLVETYSNIGFMAATEIEITGYIRRGQLILYEVQLNQVFGTFYHSIIKAYTDNKLIAHGTLVGASK